MKNFTVNYMKRILILGAGLVVKPMVEYLLEHKIPLMIASPMKERADAIINGNPLGSSVDWSMDDPPALERMIADYDLVISLLPFRYHVDVAKFCIRFKKPLITTSYVQPDMKMLNTAAKEAGVILLNEMGLDPGIDHMTAKKLIDYVHFKGGKIEEFYSLCGALPATDCTDNPLNYKFTWSPKGVMLASRNSALYLRNGKEKFVDSVNLFKDRFSHVYPGIGELEVYPNRDSLHYTEIYDILGVKTMYRGTLRYKGWCETLDAMKSIGLLDDKAANYEGMSYADFIAEKAGIEKTELRKNLALKLGVNESAAAMKSFDFLGFFDDEKLKYQDSTPFEITSDRMIKRMMLNDNDRDVVLLQHIMLASYPNRPREVIRSSMTVFGTPATNTAISRTVALPAAIAARMVLENKVMLSGVYRPVVPSIYIPVLNELRSLGIRMHEEYDLPESELIR